ncbi:PKD domain-containing protein [Candidatus Bathyarchaeota archaeon]|nr:PKD domain-containing protein [Candidatus Bathyarchaeota archaeon]
MKVTQEPRKIHFIAFIALFFVGYLLIEGSILLQNDEPHGDQNLAISDLPHATILISGDGDWGIGSNGVVAGNGSANNPWIIANWTIDGGGMTVPIAISNTRDHFVIKNCTLFNSGFTSSRGCVNLNNVTNGRVENNTWYDSYTGVYMNNCNNSVVHDNTWGMIATNAAWGINLLASHHNNLTSNLLSHALTNHDGVGVGIRLSGSSNNTIQSNWCERAATGIYLLHSDENNLTDNDCVENLRGIYIGNADDNQVVGNRLVQNTDEGIEWNTANGNEIANNTIKDRPAGSDCIVGFSGTNNIHDNDCEYCIADFSSNASVTLVGWDILFTDNSSGDPNLIYAWDFGDSSPNMTTASPIHAYSSVGMYNVTLTVWDNQAEVSSKEQIIHVVDGQACPITSLPDMHVSSMEDDPDACFEKLRTITFTYDMDVLSYDLYFCMVLVDGSYVAKAGIKTQTGDFITMLDAEFTYRLHLAYGAEISERCYAHGLTWDQTSIMQFGSWLYDFNITKTGIVANTSAPVTITLEYWLDATYFSDYQVIQFQWTPTPPGGPKIGMPAWLMFLWAIPAVAILARLQAKRR